MDSFVGAFMGVSPYSMGGGGTVLEHRYAAVLLSTLLTGSSLDELGDALIEPVEIRLQASQFSPVDDIMIIGRRQRGGDEFTVCVGVRRDPSFVPSHEPTVKLVGSYLREVTEHWGEVESGHRKLVLAAVDRSVHAFQVGALTRIANGKGLAAFRDATSRSGPTNAELRARLHQFDQVVAEAAALYDLDTGVVSAEELSWRLLSSLRVKHLRLEDGDGQDRSHAVDRLREVAFEKTLEAAEAVFSEIERRVGDWAPTAASLSKGTLHRELAARLRQRFSPIPAPGRQRELEPDAVTRGPIAHLGLEQGFAQARALESSDPAGAAARYEGLAQALDEAGWPSFSLSTRRRQAEVLHKSGDHDAGTRIDVSVMAAALEAGEPWLANAVIHRLSEEKVDAADHLIRSANALGDLAAFEHYHDVSLADVTASIDALQPECPQAVLAAAWFAEHAIAQGQPDLVRQRAAVLQALADGAAEADMILGARLHACLADTDQTGTAWRELTRSSYPPPITALLRARHARFLAETGQGQQALDRYEEAVERAVRCENSLDAASWIEAQSLVRIRYHLQTSEIGNVFPTTTVLRAARQGSVLSATNSVRERTLGRLTNQNHSAERLQALRQYLRHAVASASWSAEREAHELFGRLHLEHKLASQAAGHFTAAGSEKLLKELGAHLPEERVDLPVPARWAELPRWKRKSMFLSARNMIDLVPDEQTQAWADLALGEVSDLATLRPAMPYVHEAALGLLAEAAPAFTGEQARRFLDVTEPWHGTGTTADPRVGRPYARTLLAIARNHPSTLRVEAVDRACQAMLSDYTMAQTVLASGDVLRLHPSVVTDRCSSIAGRGGLDAALALVLAGTSADEARSLAQSLLDGHLARPGAGSPPAAATLPRSAILAGHLLTSVDCEAFAEALIMRARDHGRTAEFRQGALEALKYLAPRLTPERRSQCLQTAMDAAQGSLDSNDEDNRGTIHPYERFRIHMGTSTLRYAGLSAACRLAHAPAHTAPIVTIALPLMAHHSEDIDRHVARDLAMLPPKSFTPLIPSLAGHTSPWARALAARLWCHEAKQLDLAGLAPLFASDPSPHVRRTLARFLAHDKEAFTIRSALQQDCRRSVRLEASTPFGRS
ncbi:hypothetical protein [Streptomyces pratensis]|uniref:hypothetical protein n=1 Tax=Streptomyces pratensis TaxID=1169025 RepID=UPI001934767A|nr:hypothetical protein [Streptomyces pratensis]